MFTKSQLLRMNNDRSYASSHWIKNIDNKSDDINSRRLHKI